MKLKRIKGKFSHLKVRQRLTNLKNDIKAKPFKYATLILSLIVLGSPLKGYAKEITGTGLVDNADKNTCPNTKMGQLRELGVSTLGLKKCLDPRATPLQKALYCSRPCCIVAGLTAGYIAEKSPVGSKLHLAATACCIGSWNAYGILLLCDREKTIIAKN